MSLSAVKALEVALIEVAASSGHPMVQVITSADWSEGKGKYDGWMEKGEGTVNITTAG